MTPKEAWEIITKKMGTAPIEFHTLPLTTRTPVWFSAQKDYDQIRITNAIKNRPSSVIKTPRYLFLKTFEKVYPIYLRRNHGEKVSQEVRGITVNSVYYYSLIQFLTEET